jgi:hypothetical protein
MSRSYLPMLSNCVGPFSTASVTICCSDLRTSTSFPKPSPSCPNVAAPSSFQFSALITLPCSTKSLKVPQYRPHPFTNELNSSQRAVVTRHSSRSLMEHYFRSIFTRSSYHITPGLSNSDRGCSHRKDHFSSVGLLPEDRCVLQLLVVVEDRLCLLAILRSHPCHHPRHQSW